MGGSSAAAASTTNHSPVACSGQTIHPTTASKNGDQMGEAPSGKFTYGSNAGGQPPFASTSWTRRM